MKKHDITIIPTARFQVQDQVAAEAAEDFPGLHYTPGLIFSREFLARGVFISLSCLNFDPLSHK